MCAYPKLIAAYHVLHRLLMPRHSPCALCSLTYQSNFSKFCIKYHKEYFLAYFSICLKLYIIILYAIFKEHFRETWFLKIEQKR